VRQSAVRGHGNDIGPVLETGLTPLRGIDVTAERAWSASVSHACCAVSVGLAVATMPGDDGHQRSSMPRTQVSSL